MIPDTTRYSPGRFLWVQNRAKGCTQKGNGWLHLNVEMKPIFPAWKIFLFGFEIRLFLCRFKTLFSRKKKGKRRFHSVFVHAIAKHSFRFSLFADLSDFISWLDKLAMNNNKRLHRGSHSLFSPIGRCSCLQSL